MINLRRDPLSEQIQEQKPKDESLIGKRCQCREIQGEIVGEYIIPVSDTKEKFLVVNLDKKYVLEGTHVYAQIILASRNKITIKESNDGTDNR
jgi:hypothetical protein